jgi:copper homeostasis protein
MAESRSRKNEDCPGITMKNFFFELCAQSVEAARAGESGGADRIELCSQLSMGGITPDFDLITAVVNAVSIPVHVLIRPRAGDFAFSADEFSLMRDQVRYAKQAHAAGVAVGVMLPCGSVDVERSRDLVLLSRPMNVTFNRAFDLATDLSQALEEVISTGADCLLTSGGAPDVLAGAASIARLCRQAGYRLDIMAGGGLQLTNLVEVVRRTRVSQLHGSLTRHRSEYVEPSRDSAFNGPIAANDLTMLEFDVRESVRLLRCELKARKSQEQIVN